MYSVLELLGLQCLAFSSASFSFNFMRCIDVIVCLGGGHGRDTGFCDSEYSISVSESSLETNVLPPVLRLTVSTKSDA